MFAYCGNNPIMFSDPSGHVRKTIFPVEISGAGGKSQSEDITDSTFTKTTGMINGQGIFRYAHNRMGWGTYSKNGCGIIAIYNAMQLLGHQESLGLIEAEIFNMGGFFAAGLLGIEPWAVDSYFSSHGISCTGYSSFHTLSQDVEDGSVIVFLALNNAYTILGGAHYMTAQYVDGKYHVYNMYTNWPDPVPISSLNRPYGVSGFLYGFIVGG